MTAVRTPDAAAAPTSELPVAVARPGLALAVVLAATFLINVDTTIVNVALPALSRELRATTSDLQWVIDAYNLAFAALILTGGTISDRYGRRRTLVGGLLLFAVSSAVAATAGGVGALIAWRVVMGAAAAFVFPTTLSIISLAYPARADRAKAIGAWGAATGAAVALGPIVGGELLAHFWWGSVFVVMVPLAVVTAAAALLVVPADRRTVHTPLDGAGLGFGALGLGALVYTIIEAPSAGWGSARTLVGAVVAVLALAALVRTEQRTAHPMLDVRLFRNLRFTAASGAVTFAFFALFGFIFLIILYFQIMRGYSALEAGVRTLPVAVAIALSSGVGPALAIRIGNKAVVATGLLLVGAGYTWVALTQTATTSYGVIVMQMLLLGTGMGLSTAPATEAILTVVPPDQVGVGSAVNDATRLVGGTLGVAVIGRVYASLYRRGLDGGDLPTGAREAARASYGASRAVAAQLPPELGSRLLARADSGFLDGLHAGCGAAAFACALGAAVVLAFLPAHPDHRDQG